jgi:hypothetical protein
MRETGRNPQCRGRGPRRQRGCPALTLERTADKTTEEAVTRRNAGKHPANYTDEEPRNGIIALKKTALYGPFFEVRK